LDWALTDFSGYIAADELYDGPFCVLSIVDNRRFKRIIYEVLEHAPTAEDIRIFFKRFKAILDCRKLTLQGITTDASPLYPTPITEVFGAVPHQICEFHVIAELTKAILKAIAKVRQRLLAGMPKMPRGRPAAGLATRQARAKQHLKNKVAALFDQRHLFVKRHLSPAEQKELQRLCRGQKQLPLLRQVMDEVYRLFDRRCRSHTALNKLARLRHRVRRFKKVGKALQKLFSPSLDKALTFLDDRLLPATSNAVERGNRRHRKMQKTVYRVRAYEILRGRIALDMLRYSQTQVRSEIINMLHIKRSLRA